MRNSLKPLVLIGFLAGCSGVPRLNDMPETGSPTAAIVSDPDFILDPFIPNTPIGLLVTQTAEKHDIPVLLFHRLIRKESQYKEYAKGKSGEFGLGQIKYQTARGEGFVGSPIALFDAETNLEYSARYFKRAVRGKWGDCKYLSRYQLGANAKPRCTAYGQSLMSPP